MEPVVDVLADLITAVGTVITAFFGWITTATTSLIANPLVQLLFGIGICVLIFGIVLGLVKSASFRKRRRRK